MLSLYFLKKSNEILTNEAKNKMNERQMKKVKLRNSTLLLSVLLFSSCATIINRPTIRVNIYSDTDSVKVHINNDSLNWQALPTSIDVIRSKNNLMITAQKDTVQKQIEVKRRISTAFWLGNLFSGAGVIGYAIDLTNPKRFTYPTIILINFDNHNKPYSRAIYNTWLKPQKELLNIKISIPEGNHFYLNKGYGYGNTFGFLGISAGFEYYFSDKYCLNMDFGGLTDFIIPVPAPYDPEGSYNRSFATYGDIQLGSDYKRLHYDVGIQFTRTSYYEREMVKLFPEYIDTLKYSKIQNNLGLAFSTYFRATKHFNLGLNYYPSFFVLEKSPKFHYSHLLFFELSFRIEAYRPKNRK